MPRECKFLVVRFSQWDNYERELNAWINQGYEVKHIVPLDSLESRSLGGDHYHYYTEDNGFLFYLERETNKMPPTYIATAGGDQSVSRPWSDPKPEPKAERYLPDDDLPF